jgi:hypothetical protein
MHGSSQKLVSSIRNVKFENLGSFQKKSYARLWLEMIASTLL